MFRTAALYVVGAWLALQIADVLFPAFGISETAIRALVWAAVAGFPAALVFGWLFEIGPGGIRRTAPADAGAVAEPRPLTRRDYVLLAAFAGIAGTLAFKAAHDVRETPEESSETASNRAPREATVRLDNSIAVLPFANMSSDPENEFFCDGVAEEILQKLSDVGGLNVIGRTSSFAFKGSNYGADRISTVLGVHFVLQGSVRKSGQQLRISAQLLNEGGVQVWSQSFDRQLSNVFEIQSEIADAVANVVAARVLPKPAAGHRPKLAAYDHFLAGRALVHSRNGTRALEELRRAVELDPDFAEAHAELAVAIIIDDATPNVLRDSRAEIDRALALEPRLLRARAAEGLWLMQKDPPDAVDAERVLRAVLAEDPNNSEALFWLSNSLATQGRKDEWRAMLEQAARIDPLHPSIVATLAGMYLAAGQMDRAERLLERQLDQPALSFAVYISLREIYRATGRLADMTAISKRFVLNDHSALYRPLTMSYGLLGDYRAAKMFAELSVREAPDDAGPRLMAIDASTWQGRYGDALQRVRELPRDYRENRNRAGLAGALLARAGEYDAAIEILEPVVDPDALEPLEAFTQPHLYPQHALAWAYLHTGATSKAARLLDSEARRCDQRRAAGLLNEGLSLHHCAETELLRGHADRALAGLAEAVDAGWREYYLRQNDPYWSQLEKNPQYRELMSTVKADIDRQRAEVARRDKQENFLAKYETLLATGSPATR